MHRLTVVALNCPGESLGQALDRAFAERIKLPEGDSVHAGAPIQDTRAAPIPGPPSPPSTKGSGPSEGDGKAQEEGRGDVEGPTETSAAGIAEAGHEQTEAVDPSISSAATHSAGPTGLPHCQPRGFQVRAVCACCQNTCLHVESSNL